MHAMKLEALFTFRALAWLVALNIGTTILQYVDNILFFDDYPEPDRDGVISSRKSL